MSALTGNIAILDIGETNEEGAQRLISKILGTSGVIGSTSLVVTAQGTPNNTVAVAAGDIVIGVNDPGSASDYFYHGWLGSTGNLTVGANSSGLARIDSIVAYVAPADATSGSANNPGAFGVNIIAGTPNASPVPPTDTQIHTVIGSGNPYLVIANIAVASGFTLITSGNITDTRPFSTLSGVSRLLGSTQLTSTSQSAFNSLTAITGLATTVTIPANTAIRVRTLCHFDISVDGDGFNSQISQDGTNVASYGFITGSAGVMANSVFCETILAPTAGSHTYQASAGRVSGSGNVTPYAANDQAMFISVEIV